MKTMGFRISELNQDQYNEKALPPVDFQHVLCTGATGSGKTASLVLLTLEDRIGRGHAIIFFDHKGHEHKKVKSLADKLGRLKDVVEIGKPHSAYINILAELDTIRLKEMVTEVARSRDPYWANSAAGLIEDIILPLRKLYYIMELIKEYKVFQSDKLKIYDELGSIGIDFDVKPSFQTISQIVSSPKVLNKFKEIMGMFPQMLQDTLSDDSEDGDDEVQNKQQVYAKLLSLEKDMKAASRFVLSEDKSDTNSGNNGVLQVLDNAIAPYAKRDYMNIDEYAISGLMDNNAIIIVDTQSFGDDILKIFFESMLKKAVMRLRTGTNTAMSVFIDEANRVLSPTLDLHSDILREASVELVIAIQNEEQMIAKFDSTGWASIKGNIKHQYLIDVDHHIRYNDQELMHAIPLIINKDELDKSDYTFHTLEKNRLNLTKRFLGEIDELPEAFTVIYDLDKFEHESSVMIEGENGDSYEFSYYGESIVSSARNTYPKNRSVVLPELDLSVLDKEETIKPTAITYPVGYGLFDDDRYDTEDDEFYYDYDVDEDRY